MIISYLLGDCMQTKKTKELETWIEHANVEDLQLYMQDTKTITLPDYLHELLERKQLSKAMVIQEAQLPRTYAYQIFQGIKQPGRDKILQLAFAMHLQIEEANRLLKIAGLSPLYAKQKRDAILLFALHHHLNLYDTNLYLDEYHLSLLGNYE